MGGQLTAPLRFLREKLREHNSKEVSKPVLALWRREKLFLSWGSNPSCPIHSQLISSSFRSAYLKLVYKTTVRPMMEESNYYYYFLFYLSNDARE
jgi:hypothetical protein